MKIVQINAVCGHGSTGRIAVDIATEVESRGHVCYIAYGHGNTDYQHSYISRKLPVIFTLHDCLNFTGKCTNFTSVSCNKWKQECHKCPLYHNSGVPSIFFDWSRKMFRDKKMLYAQIERCKTIAVSHISKPGVGYVGDPN